ncbi:gas vesicle protein GvpG [Priestia koreensis]|uniref:Gas vesicle protein GvpG n=1 Tax=Priestia koreensis TaxID=284581 RepID=A0A0M0KTI6_9BACI|nr:gas vesicle protein GvpG [Priestia koreensis]KOO41922.1 gas vesicle protein GvpG [Priestia koreensis]MCM3003556.1 gas vesicle protein GvpG [Priestia koreensis]UNL86346.1 gas vesicle protein GvpG [Priestia koreensis]
MIHKLITAPLNVVIKVGQKIKEEVDQQLYDLPTIQKKLVQLQMMYELDEIPEEAFKEQEAELLLRYEEAKRRELEEWENMAKRKG